MSRGKGGKPRPFYERSSCRVCQGSRLVPFLSLGEQPLANHFLSKKELSRPEPRFPLTARFCESCGLAQLLHVVHPELLYRNYAYFSSASPPLVAHFSQVASYILENHIDSPKALVCEIGSNDGVFLKNFLGRARMVGVDPAENIATMATEQGIPTLPEFFSEEIAERILKDLGRARVIFAANVLASIDNLEGVLEGVRRLLESDGVFIFEVHRFADMVQTRCFDQIYHEHLSYFTLRPLEHILERFGMRVFDVKKIPVHGESFQVHVALESSGHAPKESVAALRKEEELLGLNDAETYFRFAGEVGELKRRLKELLAQTRSEGKRIVGYGAPGKGNILLNFCEIDREVVDYLVDTTPFKQGLFAPGSRIPIHPPERLKEDKPDCLLLLAWNYADYIFDKEQELIHQDVSFIIPIPEPKIVQLGR